MTQTLRNLAVGCALLIGGSATLPEAAAGGDEPVPIVPAERPVDLVLCLDTSNSMDGLIDAAKRRLWDIVNDLSHLKPTPHLRVALLSYGNNGYPQAEGWVVTDAPFTEDLDFISQKLFALRTNGGTEFVGRVLDAATDRLKWSEDGKALRIAVVAGNESADQDPVKPFRDVCGRAAKRGIIVNSIYCGPSVDDIAPGWREVAKLGEGEFASIDHDNAPPVCATPYDALLATLSTSYNATCIPFGRMGAASCANQLAQDGNAVSLGSDAAASRALTKVSSNYFGRNGGWDLVDACNAKQVDLAKLPEGDMPEAMRKLTLEERQRYIDEMTKQRTAIQKQITELGAKRAEYIASEMKRRGITDDDSLAGAVRRAVRRQAERKGFTFEGR